jgi:hypothetical protein
MPKISASRYKTTLVKLAFLKGKDCHAIVRDGGWGMGDAPGLRHPMLD